ncbi:MAG: Exodeoxyribonuclease 7 large subunit [Chlamydiae bacterium]|nr:Exodeoxyribonuclease 7 large subunit [Chlamydiota bacterium]
MSVPSTTTILTVTELTKNLKNQLERAFPSVVVQGEITNGKYHGSGHFYFDLKDAGAKIPAVLFNARFSSTNAKPKEGDKVIVTGSLTVYPPHGRYQLLARKIEYQGVGQLLQELEERKKKLQALGWFAPEKKRPLPQFPKTIGVITSPTGAVIRDIVHVLKRRMGGFHLLLNPVRVQGEGAAFEIAQAIYEMNLYNLADVLIVGRGGGSLEDLWPFNEEIVVKAIYESTIPIISAVGHETDVTLSDFVADVRAPTPSAAAEIVSKERTTQLDTLTKYRNHLTHLLVHKIKNYRARLQGLARAPLFSSPYSLLAEPLQKLDESKTRLDTKMRQELERRLMLLMGRRKQAFALKPSTQLSHFQQKLTQVNRSLNHAVLASINNNKQKIKGMGEKLHALDPKNVLKRGYAILFALNKGSVIMSPEETSPGERVEALLSGGKLKLKVEDE